MSLGSLSVVLASAAMACDGPKLAREESRSSTGTIIGGSISGGDHDSIVLLAIYTGDDLSTCTGTLVAPNLVLTARHCVSVTEGAYGCAADGSSLGSGGRIVANHRPADVFVYTGRTASKPALARKAAAARGLDIQVYETPTLCTGDLAFVLLDRDLDAPISPIQLGSPSVGESVTAVGWGKTEDGEMPNRRLTRTTAVIDVGPSTPSGLGPGEFAVGEVGCSGDSGGPALSRTGAVVGVFSRVGGGNGPNAAVSFCVGEGVRSVLVNLAPHRSLVDFAFAAAGRTPPVE